MEGNIGRAKGYLSRAIEVLERACEITNYSDYRNLTNLGNVYGYLSELFELEGNIGRAKGYLSRAIEVLGRACEITNYSDYLALINLGNAYYKLSELFELEGNIGRAKGYLSRAIEVLGRACEITNYSDYSSLNSLGSAYGRLSELLISEREIEEAKGNLGRAIEVLERACEITNYSDYIALTNLGIVYWELSGIFKLEESIREAKISVGVAIKNFEKACENTAYRDFRSVIGLGRAYNMAFKLPWKNELYSSKKIDRLLKAYTAFFFKKNLTLEYNLLSSRSYLVDVSREILDLVFLFAWRNEGYLTDESLRAVTTSKSPFMKALRLVRTVGKNSFLKETFQEISQKVDDDSNSLEVKEEEEDSLFVLKSMATVMEREEISLARLQFLEKLLKKANIGTSWEATDYPELIKENLGEDEALLFAYPVWQVGKFFFLILWKKEKNLTYELIDLDTKMKPEFFSGGYDREDNLASLVNFHTKQRVVNERFGKLTKMLLSDRFSHIKHIYLLPFGLLNLVPFHALTYDIPIVKRFTISYLPDVELLMEKGNGTTSIKSLIFAYEPYGRDVFYEEAWNVKKVLEDHGREVNYEKDPTKTSVKGTLQEREFEIVYFSTHGKGGFERPIDSYLFLADGKLTVADLVDMDFKADVAILSACEVNLTFSKGVDDASELERAFIVAGARNVVASTVPVNAYHTSEFLPLFVEKFLQKKSEKAVRPAAEAFREACLEMRKKGLPVWTQFRLTGTG